MDTNENESPEGFDALMARVSAEIDSHKYEYVEGLVGLPWSEEKVQTHLEAFRAALVAPYWADIKRRDTVGQVKMTDSPVSRCVIVADDTKGTVLAFDPAEEEFLLAMHFKGALESFGISGDPVSCFLAI